MGLCIGLELMDTLRYQRRQSQLESLLRRLGSGHYHQVNWSLVDLALTHPSVSSETNYEQLEFVGDSVIRLAAAEFLYKNYSQSSVGDFTAIRAILVSDRSLARIADSYGLEAFLIVKEGVLNQQASRETCLAEAFEALLGALYLSTQNLKLISSWLNRDLEKITQEILQDPARQNYKAALQEWAQGRYKLLPTYRVQELYPNTDTPDRFHAEVWLDKQQLGQGYGRSIKAAEQAAAKTAFIELQTQNLI